MAIIQAVVTDEAKEALVKLWGGLVAFTLTIDEFQVGEGGWETTPAGTFPRTPDPSLTKLDADENPSRYPADSRATYAKLLVIPGDMTFVTPSTLEVACSLLALEFTDDGFFNAPEIWEIGLFSDKPGGGRMMVAYGTFPKEIKNPVPLDNVVKIVLG